jgi:urease accessory protein
VNAKASDDSETSISGNVSICVSENLFRSITQLQKPTKLSFILGMLCSRPASAHAVIITKNAFTGGLFHSFTGLDHALAMLGVGFLSSKLGHTHLFKPPLVFLLFLAIGACSAFFGFRFPFCESIIAISCVTFGAFIALSKAQQFARMIYATTAVFGFAHGYAHLVDLPIGYSATQFTFGFLVASATMHLTGVLVGEMFKDPEHRWLIEIYSIVMRFAGCVFLLRSLQY